MSSEQFRSILSVTIIPYVIELIVREAKLGEIAAAESFYQSKTFELLSREETKLWHYSPLTLFNMWANELKTGEVQFPEEGA